MAREWRERPLGQLTENFDGRRVPVKEADRRPGPYPYYGASGIVDYVESYLFDGEYLLIAEDGENLRTRNTPAAFLARGKFWVNNHAHIVRGNDQADTRYLMYALQAADISGYLTGSTMPKLTQGSKWNKIEHRMFCHITENWRGRPLISHEVVVNLIANTTTEQGLRIRAGLDTRPYPTGVTVTPAALKALRLTPDPFHGDWNYLITPHR